MIQGMACDLCNANEDSLRRLKRVLRCFFLATDQACSYPWSDGQAMRHLVVYTDSDWARDHWTRNSSSCAVLQVDGCVLCVICLSWSTDPTSAVFGGLMWERHHVQELLAWFGEPMRARL